MEFREMVGHSFGSTLIDGRQEEAGRRLLPRGEGRDRHRRLNRS